jgi:hypothetical protein
VTFYVCTFYNIQTTIHIIWAYDGYIICNYNALFLFQYSFSNKAIYILNTLNVKSKTLKLNVFRTSKSQTNMIIMFIIYTYTRSKFDTSLIYWLYVVLLLLIIRVYINHNSYYTRIYTFYEKKLIFRLVKLFIDYRLCISVSTFSHRINKLRTGQHYR